MNHSASFGYLLGFKVNTIIDFNNITTISKFNELTCKEYYELYDKYDTERFVKIESKQQITGRRLAVEQSKSIYVTLNPNKVNDEKIPYKDYYLDNILQADEEKFIFYDVNGSELISSLINIKKYSEIELLNDVYLIPKKLKDIDLESIDKFCKHLIEKQKTDINALRESSFEVTLVSEINLQVFLNKIDELKKNGSCLFMFVNQQTLIHSGMKLVAFQTKMEQYVSDSFISIITETIKKNKKQLEKHNDIISKPTL